MPTLPPLRSVTSSWPDDGAHDRGRATRSRHLCREVPVSIDVFFTEPVDYLIGYDGTPASKWTKAKKDLIIRGWGFGVWGSGFAIYMPSAMFAARRSPFADTVRIRSSGILLGWRHQRPALLLQNRAEAMTDRLTFAA